MVRITIVQIFILRFFYFDCRQIEFCTGQIGIIKVCFTCGQT